jgi:DNA-binding transcriptional regulator WhiA
MRLAYPEANLEELRTHFDPPISKSGLNHRLRKIIELAEI